MLALRRVEQLLLVGGDAIDALADGRGDIDEALRRFEALGGDDGAGGVAEARAPRVEKLGRRALEGDGVLAEDGEKRGVVDVDVRLAGRALERLLDGGSGEGGGVAAACLGPGRGAAVRHGAGGCLGLNHLAANSTLVEEMLRDRVHGCCSWSTGTHPLITGRGRVEVVQQVGIGGAWLC